MIKKIPAAVAAALFLSATAPVWAARGAQGTIPPAVAEANAVALAAGKPLPPMPLRPGGILMPLWEPGSPGFNPAALTTPETYGFTENVPDRAAKTYNVTNPSIEVHRVVPLLNTGMAVILAPGGGNTELSTGTEGIDFIPFFYNYGINTVILRYSLAGTGGNANADAIQAIRMVRAHAQEWGLDPKKIGFAGFSAGGERAAFILGNYDAGNPDATDPVAKASSRPDFILDVYPSGTVQAPPQNAPAIFIAVAGQNDRSHASASLNLATALINAGVENVELHMYGQGVHPGDRFPGTNDVGSGGMTDRNGLPFGTWQYRFIDWARDLGFLNKPGVPTKVDALSQTAPVAGRGARGAAGQGTPGAGGPRGGGRRAAGAGAPGVPPTINGGAPTALLLPVVP